MKIEKAYLKLFISVLEGTHPKFIEARLRNRALKDIYDIYIPFEKEKTALCEKYCIKNEDGSPKIEKGVYLFEEKEREEFNTEFLSVAEEMVTVPLTGGEDMRMVKLIESTEFRPSELETEQIDRILIATLLGKRKKEEDDKATEPISTPE